MVTLKVMTGFLPGQDYFFRFRLVCQKGEGPRSPTRTCTSH